jgi:hypothetical protein
VSVIAAALLTKRLTCPLRILAALIPLPSIA